MKKWRVSSNLFEFDPKTDSSSVFRQNLLLFIVGKMWTWTMVSKLWNSDCIHEYIVHLKHSGKHCVHKNVICFPCSLLKQQKQTFKDWKLKNAKEHCWTDSEILYKRCLLKTDVCDCLHTRKTHYSNKYAHMNIKRSFSDQDLLLALKNGTKVSTEISTLLPCIKSTAGNVHTNTPHLWLHDDVHHLPWKKAFSQCQLWQPLSRDTTDTKTRSAAVCKQIPVTT